MYTKHYIVLYNQFKNLKTHTHIHTYIHTHVHIHNIKKDEKYAKNELICSLPLFEGKFCPDFCFDYNKKKYEKNEKKMNKSE